MAPCAHGTPVLALHTRNMSGPHPPVRLARDLSEVHRGVESRLPARGPSLTARDCGRPHRVERSLHVLLFVGCERSVPLLLKPDKIRDDGGCDGARRAAGRQRKVSEGQ